MKKIDINFKTSFKNEDYQVENINIFYNSKNPSPKSIYFFLMKLNVTKLFK